MFPPWESSPTSLVGEGAEEEINDYEIMMDRRSSGHREGGAFPVEAGPVKVEAGLARVDGGLGEGDSLRV